MTKPEPAPLVYLDTCIYIDLLARNEDEHKETGRPRWESAKAVLDAVNADRVILAASALLEAEVNCISVVRDGSESINEQVRGWFTAVSTQWTDIDRFLGRDAARLARQWQQFSAPNKRLGGADATHLAAAVRLGCSYLMTHDEGFPIGQNVDGVQVMRPAEVWERDLLDELADADQAELADATPTGSSDSE
ncbi:type II toxin-antitoxin system VapC family toxin [Mycolicibacterium helvum]|uniref:PIN domain-containing protein n=1 Tax=Mycolicibacterium helvum TaxID=1534349 RepID=A0A7I7TEN4_9MYCO|nr:PIN domain-containing protein [Mycolicibacterium helvum]BBY67568.1 hypothetical protein MHEL_58110 [Mycolicibacterium helvum]